MTGVQTCALPICRKIQDIEHYTQQNLKPSVIAGLEPQQRFAPTSDRPRGNFGGDRGGPRNFGGGGGGRFGNDRAPSRGFGGGGGGYAGKKPAFGDRGADRGGFAGNRDDRGGSFQGRPAPQGNNYADRSGFNDRNARRPDDRGFGNNNGGFAQRDDRGGDRGFGGRSEGFSAAPRGDFADRKPAFAKPAGKVFVPRDAQKRPARPAR